ncbi:MAG: hypothetical protein ACPKPY_03135 [Nitrososphaeraceae archaeon]
MLVLVAITIVAIDYMKYNYMLSIMNESKISKRLVEHSSNELNVLHSLELRLTKNMTIDIIFGLDDYASYSKLAIL